MEGKPIVVRKVYAYNLRAEFFIIEQNLATYRFIAVDTEFLGTIFCSQKPYHQLLPEENYQLMKKNVNSLKFIQLGLTLPDSSGKLPDLGTDSYFIWEFNFREFEEEEDLHNPDAVNLLKAHGIDFVKNLVHGISFVDFAKFFIESRLGFSLRSFIGCKRESDPHKLTWVFFHSTYDIGYLIKVLTQQDLPKNHVRFMALVMIYLGTLVFDVKEIVKPLGWQAGLEKMAAYFGVNRMVG